MYLVFVLPFITGNASAVPVMNIVDGDACAIVDVTGTGYGDADQCIGLLDNAGAGGLNDSEDLLNNSLAYGNNDGDVIWDVNGAFGHNDWMFLGKDDQTTNTFIDAMSGDPGTWSVDGLLNGTFLIAIKQGGELGFWYFDALVDTTDGLLYFNDIFGDGFTDDGWSHVSIYGTPSSTIPEPTVLALLSVGLIGFGLTRRKVQK